MTGSASFRESAMKAAIAGQGLGVQAGRIRAYPQVHWDARPGGPGGER
jgi:hypothetical protein